ncbi:MAG: GNAT family N-acetyltransferase [Mycoplasmatales bacterium]
MYYSYHQFTDEIKQQIMDLEYIAFKQTLTNIYLVDSQILFIVEQTEDELCGFCSFKINDLGVDIFNIAVVDKYKRKGIATKLFKMLPQEYDIVLEVKPSNKQAIEFYKSQGLNFSHTLLNYYQNEDAFVFIKRR